MNKKRRLILTLGLMFLLPLSGCSTADIDKETVDNAGNLPPSTEGTTDKKVGEQGHISRQIEEIIGSSELFTKKEIISAMDAVKLSFQQEWEDATLTKLHYDEDFNIQMNQRYIENPDYYGEITDRDIIVLRSEFQTDEKLKNENPLNGGVIYTDWYWVVVKDQDGQWQVKDSGI